MASVYENRLLDRIRAEKKRVPRTLPSFVRVNSTHFVRRSESGRREQRPLLRLLGSMGMTRSTR